MAEITRVSVEEARRKSSSGQALLVCAYDDEAKCRTFNLEGSVSLKSFEAKARSLPKNKETVFYCA